jgi:integrase
MGKLTDKEIKAAKIGYHADGDGLYLQVTGSDKRKARSWLFRYKVGKKTTWLGLGSYSTVPLTDAREAAFLARKQLRQGVDPLQQKRAALAAQKETQRHTFKDVAHEYIEEHKAGWRNEKHAAQWETTLKTYAYPVLGDLEVNLVALEHILRVLRPIWTEKPETASRVRGRIESILDYAAVHSWRTGENPAHWQGYLSEVLPAKTKVAKVEHHAALSWKEMPEFWIQLCEKDAVSARCLQFLILTASRSGESRGASWDEIDLKENVWTIPADRMKASRPHRVPLSEAAIRVIKAVTPFGGKPHDLIFPGGRKAAPLSDVAVSKALHTIRGGFTVHGFRSTFRDWCAESIGTPREVAEAALAHVNRDRVEAAYARTDHLERRRKLMAMWSEFLAGTNTTA